MNKQIDAKWLVVFGFIIVSLFGMVLLLGTTPESQSVEPASQPRAEHNPEEIQQSVKSTFIDGCSESVSRAFCTCAYDHLVDNYGLSILVEMDSRGMYSEYSQGYIYETINACEAKGVTI